MLRDLVAKAELIYEHAGPVNKDPANVLTEALRTAGDDFALFADEGSLGEGTASSMALHRAKLRCQLAIALFEYRQEIGFPESANEVEPESRGGFMTSHEMLVVALTANSDPKVAEDVVGGALSLAIGEARALVDYMEGKKGPEELLAYSLVSRLDALSSLIAFSCKVDWKAGAGPDSDPASREAAE